MSASNPVVSVVMANYCGAAHIEAALASVLGQTVHDIEVIVADDASTDASVDIVARLAEADPRIRLLTADRNGGPGVSRNRALDAANGEWIAIVDSDDLIRAERFERLIGAAERLGADAIADDLRYFSSDGSAKGTLLGSSMTAPTAITPAVFVRSNIENAGAASLGYLKPMIRRARLGDLRYDETLRIGEDYDFLLRFLLTGARFCVLPEPLYSYRRHASSISHRLSEATVMAMIDSHRAFVSTHGPFDRELAGLFEAQMQSLQEAAAYERLVQSIKSRKVFDAAVRLAASPRLLRPLARSAYEHFTRTSSLR
jgi:succinoglycan biosynthesis protein ExoO